MDYDYYESEVEDEYTRGWRDAHEAITQRKVVDYSQGDTDWDRGWNHRLEQEDKVD
jgi:hypothetical protein